jgi:hypothetical protein
MNVSYLLALSYIYLYNMFYKSSFIPKGTAHSLYYKQVLLEQTILYKLQELQVWWMPSEILQINGTH